MSTTMTPPPPTQPPAPAPQPRGSARVVAILAITFGALLIIGAVFTGLFSTLSAGARQSGALTAGATGIRSLTVDVAAAEFSIEYGGDVVSLDVRGNADDWHLERDGDSLTVRTDRGWWGAWRVLGENDVAVLTLPASLQNVALDANLSLSAGVMRAEGRYGDLDLNLSAGSLEVSGRADTMRADVSAGRLVFGLDGVADADVHVSAGAVTGEVTGSAPDDVTVEISAGRLELTLPDEPYVVTSDVSAGEFDNRLRVDSQADSHVSVSVSAGFAQVRS